MVIRRIRPCMRQADGLINSVAKEDTLNKTIEYVIEHLPLRMKMIQAKFLAQKMSNHLMNSTFEGTEIVFQPAPSSSWVIGWEASSTHYGTPSVPRKKNDWSQPTFFKRSRSQYSINGRCTLAVSTTNGWVSGVRPCSRPHLLRLRTRSPNRTTNDVADDAFWAGNAVETPKYCCLNFAFKSDVIPLSWYFSSIMADLNYRSSEVISWND